MVVTQERRLDRLGAVGFPVDDVLGTLDASKDTFAIEAALGATSRSPHGVRLDTA
jgi:hypothetical protein